MASSSSPSPLPSTIPHAGGRSLMDWSETELDLAEVLRTIPEETLRRQSGGGTGVKEWSKRRGRSRPHQRRPGADPPPATAVGLPEETTDEGKVESPSTPFSFSASDGPASKPPPGSRRYRARRMAEMRRKAGGLPSDNADLQNRVAKIDGVVESLRPKNSVELFRSELLQGKMPRDGSAAAAADLRPPPPVVRLSNVQLVLSLGTAVRQHNLAEEPLALRPRPANEVAAALPLRSATSDAADLHARNRGETPAARAAQARQRRMEIQREKSRKSRSSATVPDTPFGPGDFGRRR